MPGNLRHTCLGIADIFWDELNFGEKKIKVIKNRCHVHDAPGEWGGTS